MTETTRFDFSKWQETKWWHWSRFTGWLNRRAEDKRIEEARKVYQMVVWIPARTTYTDVNRTYYHYYYLFQNGHGQRKIEVKSDDPYFGARVHPLYFSEIIPWSYGYSSNDKMITLSYNIRKSFLNNPK